MKISAAILSMTAVSSACLGQCLPRWVDGPLGSPGLWEASVHAVIEWDRDGPDLNRPLIIAAGDFLVAGGIAAAGVAAWDGSHWFALSDNTDLVTARALTVSRNGQLVVGGHFTSQSRVVMLDGSTWSSVGPPMGGGGVTGLVTLPGGDIIAGGSSLNVNGQDLGYIARFDGATWHSLGAPFAATALVVMMDGSLVAGGPVGNGSRVAAWRGGAWEMWWSIPEGTINALAVSPGGELIAGGQFNAGVTTTYRVAKRDAAGQWSPVTMNYGPFGGGFSAVQAVAVLPNGDIIAGGLFSSVEGLPANNIVGWRESSGWYALGSGTAGSSGGGAVSCLRVLSGGGLVAAGAFEFLNGQSAGRIGLWDRPTAPSVLQQPSPAVTLCGGVVTLSAATDEATASYRWRRGGLPLTDGAARSGAVLHGATSATLVIANAQSEDSGGYDCEITASCGSALSSVAALTVLDCCRADFNGNGSVSNQDLFDFLAAFFGVCP